MSRIVSVERPTSTTVVFHLSDGFCFGAHFGADPAESFEVFTAISVLLDENERLREEAQRVRVAVESLTKAVTL